MSKPPQQGLFQEVRDAQRVVNAWSAAKRESIRIEGHDSYYDRSVNPRSYVQSLGQDKPKTNNLR